MHACMHAVCVQELLADVRTRPKKQVYIFKPDAGCQGRGIRLAMGGKEENITKVCRQAMAAAAPRTLMKPWMHTCTCACACVCVAHLRHAAQ